MALTVSAVTRAVRGTFISQGLSSLSPIDSVTAHEDLVVVGNPGYSTLITGDTDALFARVDSSQENAQLFANTVWVSYADSPELRDKLAARGLNAILGCALEGDALHAAITALLVEDRAASDRLVSSGMKVLTQAARRGGVTAVIAELTHRVNGWAVLLDPQGQLIASAGAGRLHVTDASAVALGRPVRVRHEGLQIHQVGSDRDLAGYLVIATRSGTMSHARDLASLAAELCDLLLRTHDPSRTDHLGREALMKTLLDGGPAALELLRRWGVHEHTLTAFALGSRSRTIDAERILRRWLHEMGAEYVFASRGGRMLGFVREDLVPNLLQRVEELRPVAGQRLHVGVGTAAPGDNLSYSASQALQALETALDDGQTVVHYERVSSVSLVLGALAETPRAQLAQVLDPLRDDHGIHGDLTATLRVFLAENGRHRVSADRLGIHRQTLTARLQRVEDLTGLSLAQVDDRTTAWLALRAIDGEGVLR
ncbi:helix-turn-helix domain-containing protein [Leucobacter sp. cx-42]|uniref:PucR family transcriptional regulator n=1 Tax=unclassified Leucobacter TaxID=2621730 RepID=UPI00165D5B3A|nr:MULTISPECIES: helix-turn-helix domain-containing protein [unclassified Leucobacter]MBC9954545.1 helix-turn-helix domain-containing protein [Leucobacter sp. cx-42]